MGLKDFIKKFTKSEKSDTKSLDNIDLSENSESEKLKTENSKSEKFGEEKSEFSKREIVSLSNLENWTDSKIVELEKKEKEVIFFIEERIAFFSEEIREKIKVASNVNLDSRREIERIKSAVEDGRKKYLESLESLIDGLKNIKKESLEKTISDIDRTVSDFNKLSARSYERATILIGKEIAEIKKYLRVFSGEIIDIFEKNKIISESLKNALIVKIKLTKYKKTKEEIKRISKLISDIEKSMSDKEKDINDLLIKIESIKQSEEYKKEKQKQENLLTLKTNLEKGIDKNLSELKRVIDFKSLGNFYHIFENEMHIVKLYKEDFNTNFRKDNGKVILGLLEKAKLITAEITDKINKIVSQKNEMDIIEEELDKIKFKKIIDDLYSKNAKIILELGDLKIRNLQEGKVIENLNSDSNLIKEEINNHLNRIGAELDFN
jgi:hypothetical protein